MKYAWLLFLPIFVFFARGKTESTPVSAPLKKVTKIHKHKSLVIRAPPAEMPSTDVTPETFRQYLHDDRLCEIAVMDYSSEAFSLEFLKSLELDYDSQWRVFTTPNSPYAKDWQFSTSDSEAANFLNAIREAGMLGGLQGGGDLDRAAETLTRLHEQDSSNAAYLLFRLAIEDKQGKSYSEKMETINALWSANRFDSHSLSLSQEVEARMRQNASKTLVGISLLSRLPFPSYSGPLEVLRTLDSQTPGIMMHVAGLMLVPGLIAQEASSYDAVQYALARKFLEANTLPDVAELDSKKHHANNVNPVLEKLKSCDDKTHQHALAALDVPR